MQMEGDDRRFTLGQQKGSTYEEISHKLEYVTRAMAQPNPAAQNFLTWLHRCWSAPTPPRAMEEVLGVLPGVDQAITADDATADLNPEAVEAVLGLGTDASNRFGRASSSDRSP